MVEFWALDENPSYDKKKMYTLSTLNLLNNTNVHLAYDIKHLICRKNVNMFGVAIPIFGIAMLTLLVFPCNI